jgi:hypothetical protein
MIALLFDSALSQSTCSTSQPNQQKSLWRHLPQSPDPLAERSIPQATTSRRGPSNSSIEDADGRYPRPAAEASKKHRSSSSNSSDDPFHSANILSADRLCLVCDAHCSASCAVCDQDFCNTHLYACVECDNQYCSCCLDDHRANGHWTDSDTAAELNHSWRNKSAFGGFRIGSMNLSPPTGRNVLAITKPRVSLTPAPSRVVGHTQRSGTAQRNTLNDVPTLISFLLRPICQGLSSSADRRTVNDHTTVKLLSQEIPLEVSL